MPRILILVVTILAGAHAMAQAAPHNGYQTPDYQVERAEGATELRVYAPHLVAEVTLAGTRNQTIGRGFRALANYIFGDNADGTKIAMTAPVAQVPVDQGYVVRFSMPKGYDLETLPRPKNSTVRLVEIAPGRQAVLRFSGLWTASRLASHERQLTDWVADQGLRVAGPVHYYFYDDPFTLPWKRRNEVALPIAAGP